MCHVVVQLTERRINSTDDDMRIVTLSLFMPTEIPMKFCLRRISFLSPALRRDISSSSFWIFKIKFQKLLTIL